MMMMLLLLLWMQMKNTVTDDDYKAFQRALQKYKTGGLCVQDLVEEALDIFSRYRDQPALFQELTEGFLPFVPSSFAGQYRVLLQRYTALLSQGQKTSRPRSEFKEEEEEEESIDLENDEYEEKDDEGKEDNEERDQKMFGGGQSTLLGQSSQESPRGSQESGALRASTGDQSPRPVVRSSSRIDLLTGEMSPKGAKRPKLATVQQPIRLLRQPPLPTVISTNSSLASPPRVTSPPPLATTTTTMDETEDEGAKGGGIECLICRFYPTDPHLSKCGHICCKKCWDQWLAIKLECPACKAQTRQGRLVKMHLI
jgi:hypothetical protein